MRRLGRQEDILHTKPEFDPYYDTARYENQYFKYLNEWACRVMSNESPALYETKRQLVFAGLVNYRTQWRGYILL